MKRFLIACILLTNWGGAALVEWPPAPRLLAQDGNQRVEASHAAADSLSRYANTSKDAGPVLTAIVRGLEDARNESGHGSAGGVVELPHGSLTIKTPIDIACPGVRFEGPGSASVVDRTCCLINDTGGGPVFRLLGSAASTSFCSWSGFSIVAKEEKPVPGSCGVEIQTADKGMEFRAEYDFERLGIWYQDQAVRIVRPTETSGWQVGHIRIGPHCRFQRNNVALETMGPTSINCLTMDSCSMSQNLCPDGAAAVKVRVFGGSIDMVNLEGQPRGLRLYDSRAVDIGVLFAEYMPDYVLLAEGVQGLRFDPALVSYYRAEGDDGRKKFRIVGDL